MSNCLEISCLKRWNLKKNTKERKNTKIGRNQKAYCFRPIQSKYPIIDIISLSYNLVTHFVSPILQKEAIKIVVKGLIMLKIQSFRVSAPYIYCSSLHKWLYFTPKVDFEKLNNYSTPQVLKLKKILQYTDRGLLLLGIL
jgi:hypothetical protein